MLPEVQLFHRDVGPNTPGSRQIAPKMGQYRLLSRLAVGGAATIYRAEWLSQSGLIPVIFKRLHCLAQEHPTLAQSLTLEAQLAERMSHPNIRKVLHSGSDAEGPFLMLEYVEGIDLHVFLQQIEERQGILPQALGGFILKEILAALIHAHGVHDGDLGGLIHRDLSPHNVLLGQDGRVLLTDFGVAQFGQSTKDSCPVGKLGHLSPEQLQGQPLTQHADIFAAGIIAYQLLVGAHPFLQEADSEAQVMERTLRGDFPDPHHVAPELCKPLRTMLCKALDPKPSQRFESAASMALALNALAIDDATCRAWLRRLLKPSAAANQNTATESLL